MKCYIKISLLWISWVMITVLAGCGGGSGSGGSDTDDAVTSNEIAGTYSLSMEVTGHPENTLMAVAAVQTSSNATVYIQFETDAVQPRQTDTSDNSQDHELVVYGMRADTTYRLKAIATYEDGTITQSEPVEFTTGSLPSGAPDVSLTRSSEESMGGITLFGVSSGDAQVSNSEPVYYGVDEAGEIVWYLHGGDSAPMTPNIRRIEPGVLMVFLTDSVRTITPEGETITDYDLSSIGGYHHDAILLPNGNVMMLGSETGTFGGKNLAGDTIREIDANGNLLWQWSSFDHLDTNRFPGDLSGTTNARGDGLDWSHCNSLFYIKEERAILLSSRSQSWVIKIDYDTGGIIWLLGDRAGTAAEFDSDSFTLTDGTWMANQHAAMLASDGGVLLYDNRNESDGSTLNSRAVKYQLDETDMTAVQSWEAIAPVYTMSFGDVDELANGNVLMCAGGPDGGDTGPGSVTAHIIEVSSDAAALMSWELTVNRSVYRAERVRWDDFLLGAGTSSSNGSDLTYAVVDTGQSACFDDSAEIPCPAAAAAFYGQDAQHSGNQPSYTLSNDGLTVYDHVTGLTWTRSPDLDGDGDIDVKDKLTFDDSQTYPGLLNARNFGGYTDWRLPTIKELYSLMNFTGTDPSGSDTQAMTPFIDTDYFDFAYGDTDAGERSIDAQFWSANAYSGYVFENQAAAFGLNLADGRIKGYPTAGPVVKTNYVYFVRGNTDYGVNNYIDNGDGTVTDRATGLMWTQDDSAVGMNWEQALAWTQQQNDLNYLGYSDWRLPNAKEMQTIVDYSRAPDATGDAAIDPVFNMTQITNEAGVADYPWFWTGTTHMRSNGSGAAGVYICFGRAMGYMNDTWMDVHGAGAQRSDQKGGDFSGFTYVPDGYYFKPSPQGDAARIYNYVRLVRDAQRDAQIDE